MSTHVPHALPHHEGRLYRTVVAFENLAAGLSLIGAVTTALGAVLLRELFGIHLFWTEEVIIYLVISSTFFGSVLTLRSNEHVNVDIITVFLEARGKRVMAIIAAVVTLLYMLCIGILAWMLLFEPFSRTTVTPALKLPLWVVELPVALALTLMFFHSIDKLRYAWTHGADEASAADIAMAEAEAADISAEDLEASRHTGFDPEMPPHIPGDPLHYIPPKPGEPGHPDHPDHPDRRHRDRNRGGHAEPGRPSTDRDDDGQPPAGKGEPR